MTLKTNATFLHDSFYSIALPVCAFTFWWIYSYTFEKARPLICNWHIYPIYGVAFSRSQQSSPNSASLKSLLQALALALEQDINQYSCSISKLLVIRELQCMNCNLSSSTKSMLSVWNTHNHFVCRHCIILPLHRCGQTWFDLVLGFSFRNKSKAAKTSWHAHCCQHGR